MKRLWDDRKVRADPNSIIEDIEVLNLDKERLRDTLAEYANVERVIGVRKEDGEVQYLVKCMNGLAPSLESKV